jgi:hypothetical protein
VLEKLKNREEKAQKWSKGRMRILCLRNRQRSLSKPSYFSFHYKASLKVQMVAASVNWFTYKKKKKETEENTPYPIVF